MAQGEHCGAWHSAGSWCSNTAFLGSGAHQGSQHGHRPTWTLLRVQGLEAVLLPPIPDTPGVSRSSFWFSHTGWCGSGVGWAHLAGGHPDGDTWPDHMGSLTRDGRTLRGSQGSAGSSLSLSEPGHGDFTLSTWDLAVPELSLLVQMGELPGEFGSPRGGGGHVEENQPLGQLPTWTDLFCCPRSKVSFLGARGPCPTGMPRAWDENKAWPRRAPGSEQELSRKDLPRHPPGFFPPCTLTAMLGCKGKAGGRRPLYGSHSDPGGIPTSRRGQNLRQEAPSACPSAAQLPSLQDPDQHLSQAGGRVSRQYQREPWEPAAPSQAFWLPRGVPGGALRQHCQGLVQGPCPAQQAEGLIQPGKETPAPSQWSLRSPLWAPRSTEAQPSKQAQNRIFQLGRGGFSGPYRGPAGPRAGRAYERGKSGPGSSRGWGQGPGRTLRTLSA